MRAGARAAQQIRQALGDRLVGAILLGNAEDGRRAEAPVDPR